MKQKSTFLTFLFLLATANLFISSKSEKDDDRFVSIRVDPHKQDIQFYWKNDKNENFKSIQNLKSFLEKRNKTLVFAMNGGMYKKDNSPQGLYIENGKTLSPLDTHTGGGNFYLQPNGVFYLTSDNVPVICTTKKFKSNKKINYATQSGPMLVIDGKIHPAFKEGSANLNIRNGVGVLPNGDVVFAISKKEINFYDFAKYFKDLGCKNALYLDGFVSRAYYPEKKWEQLDGDFGMMVGVTEK